MSETSFKPNDIENYDTVECSFTSISNMLNITFDMEDNYDYVVCISGIKDKDANTLGNDICLTYTSTYSPVYASISNVLCDINSAASNILPSYIYQIIRSNSIDIADLISDTIDLTGTIPYNVQQYIRYKTDVDILTNRIMEISSSGSASSTLGDFSISYSSSQITALQSVLKIFDGKANQWFKQILTTTDSSIIQSFVKGGTDWPTYMTRSF